MINHSNLFTQKQHRCFQPFDFICNELDWNDESLIEYFQNLII